MNIIVAWLHANVVTPIRREDGFQTAEAIGIAAVGVLVLFAIWGVLEALGVEVVGWMKNTFGIGSPPASS